MSVVKRLLLAICCLHLASCHSLSGDRVHATKAAKVRKPTTLSAAPTETTVTKVWSTSVGSGISKKSVNLIPVLDDDAIYTADAKGIVTAVSRATGKITWQTNARTALVSGPALGNDVVIVGTHAAEVIALRSDNGHQLWRRRVSNEVLAPAAISGGHVVVKTVDGRVFCFNSQNGQEVWSHIHGSPSLILRGSSAPTIVDNTVIAGFEDGKLAALDLATGESKWEVLVAGPRGLSAIERMIDINVNPVVQDGVVYVASYQGALVAVDAESGQVLWRHPLSAYAGLTVVGPEVVVTDADSHVWSVGRENGRVLWRQDKLATRQLTAPVVMGDSLVVADAEGYVHWLAQDDGHFTARVKASRKGILAPPLVDGKQVYVLSNDGSLTKYQVA